MCIEWAKVAQKWDFFGLLYNIVLLQYLNIFKKSIDEAYFIKYNYKCKGNLRHFYAVFPEQKNIGQNVAK